MGNYKLAKQLLEQAYIIYKKVYLNDDPAILRVSTYLGSVYRNIGEYKKAEEVLSEAYITYKKSCGNDSINTAWAAAYLDSVFNSPGRYKDAGKPLDWASRFTSNIMVLIIPNMLGF